MQKSQQQMEQEIVAYLNQTSKHLFIDKNGYLFKIILFRNNDKWYYATVKFNSTDINISIKEALSDITYKVYGNSSLQAIKSTLFPKGHGMKSIPNFKASRVVINKSKNFYLPMMIPSSTKLVLTKR